MHMTRKRMFDSEYVGRDSWKQSEVSIAGEEKRQFKMDSRTYQQYLEQDRFMQRVAMDRDFTAKRIVDEDGSLSKEQREKMILSDKGVDRLISASDVLMTLQVSIEESAITQDLQKKLASEVKCAKCYRFPYMPQECKICFKVFCVACTSGF